MKKAASKLRLTHVNPSLALAVVGVVGLAAPTFGSSISALESSYSGTNITGATIGNTGGGDPAAVIQYIGSSPQTLDGYTYTNYALITNDGTGSAEVFGHLPASDTTETAPAVGDAINATGTYTVFDGIPELETLTALSQVSTGNAVSAPLTVTIPTITSIEATQPPKNNGLNEYLIQLDNVFIDANGTSTPAGGTFPVHATANYTLSDGVNTLTMFLWASSYSASGALGGTAIPTGPVDIMGIADYFSPNAEFVPFSVTAVPEPASLGLMAVGAVALMRRRNRTA